MRLVVHIGAAKCGSTSIQTFLAANLAVLREQSILVPDPEMGTSGDVTGDQVSLFGRLWENDAAEKEVGQRLSKLSRHMAANKIETAVISAENLIGSVLYAKTFASARQLFDSIKIVAYVRRQDDYILSSWRQWWMKWPDFPTFDSYLQTVVGREADWFQLIEPWEKVFGIESVTVRRFQRGALVNRNVVEDFCEVTGISREGTVSVDVANPTMSDELADLAFDIRGVFSSVHDDRFFALAYGILQEDALKIGRQSWLLSMEERMEILSVYEPSNERLKQRYFPELGGKKRLFSTPTFKEVGVIDPEEWRRRKYVIACRLLATLVKERLEGRA
jgi:hypothetical protein